MITSLAYRPSQLIEAGPPLTRLAKKAIQIGKHYPRTSLYIHQIDWLIHKIGLLFSSIRSQSTPIPTNKVPPPEDSIELKTATCAFNHIQDFVIKDEVIWTRTRGIQQVWKRIEFDGEKEKAIPIALSCDGANLIVLDQYRNVHYKKVLGELRAQEVNDYTWHRLNRSDVDPNFNYIAIDKATRQNWKKRWFTLPYLCHLTTLFTKRRLHIPQEVRAWSISHRGRYNNYLEDKEGNRHPAFTGVTTLYMLTASGKDLLKYDPWSPKYVKMSIPLPETASTTFEAENVNVSASTVMVIGYEIDSHNPTKKILHIQTRLADMDSEGWNPGLKYGYFSHPKDKDVQVIPLAHWQKHPIDLEEGDYITKNITILQIGEGNQARELRVEGIHHQQKGYYFKKIDEERWRFKPYESAHHSFDESSILPLVQENNSYFQTTVHDYHAEQLKINSKVWQQTHACLKKFGLRSFHSIINCYLESTPLTLDLYKRKTWRSFLGFKGEIYELVIPKKYHSNIKIMNLFKNKKVIPVRVSEKKENVILKSSTGLHWTFTAHHKVN